MFDILRLARAASRNPWVAVPVFGLIAGAFIIQAAVLGTGENPLPKQALVRSAAITRHPSGSTGLRDLSLRQYVDIRQRLNGCEPFDAHAGHPRLATLFVRTADQSVVEARFYPGAVLEVNGAFYRADDEDEVLDALRSFAGPAVAPPSRR